ncbi:MAG: bifunctional molybdenum cofactor biosynthesis protein MoaC/MoaB [Bacteroidetes bacterium RIFCSPLOWO2_02_FULL_36_8]|nr:MAG: bifunctional molybdenum cofactor biosynthesis protein MoaC/MoaB [Bacteroidetes bacterium RIFCSPLOWO2_02_FULL_36_8]OFY70235.1 MAG: bifunctional molybdenum cofactor biosynthesis protein MoaC/MoaB [Bacteroidetes bacterium RIFCSPLOWO2_12_FULL_37_12]
MIDITPKRETLRTAKAHAVIRMKQETVSMILNNKIPKGNVLETARTAGYLGVKRTSDILPLCHPMPVEWVNFTFYPKETDIEITAEVKTIYKTGCEMEALTGASVTALCIYDMVKPVDKNVEILSIRLMEKKGGKSQYGKIPALQLSAAVVVISDSVSAGKSMDQSGEIIRLNLFKHKIETKLFSVVSDDKLKIQSEIKKLCKSKINLILTTGGTGLSLRDNTTDVIRPLLDKEISGIMESARIYGDKRTPYTMLSRGVAGMIGETLIITLPGSPRAVQEYLDALFPYVLHVFDIHKGGRH